MQCSDGYISVQCLASDSDSCDSLRASGAALQTLWLHGIMAQRSL